jgi:hypothetical protein
MGYGPFSLCVIHKEGLCPSSWDDDENKLKIITLIALIIELIISLK